MIYIVSGHPRTGTTMLMQMGEAGGLEVYKSPERDVWAAKFGDREYSPNRRGLYELLDDPRQRFLRDPTPHEGKLVKILYKDVVKLAVRAYRVVFMERDFEEIRQSFFAFLGQPIGLTEDSYHRAMDYSKGILRQRRDVELKVLWYRDVVDDPVTALTSLGWPIDIGLAAAVVDPAQCRYRAEDLQRGVLGPGERVGA